MGTLEVCRQRTVGIGRGCGLYSCAGSEWDAIPIGVAWRAKPQAAARRQRFLLFKIRLPSAVARRGNVAAPGPGGLWWPNLGIRSNQQLTTVSSFAKLQSQRFFFRPATPFFYWDTSGTIILIHTLAVVGKKNGVVGRQAFPLFN
jgi:hypothetical protein